MNAGMKNSQKNRKRGVFVLGDGSCSPARPFVSGKYPPGSGFAGRPGCQLFSARHSASIAARPSPS
jgi:hypothetical protein